MLNAVPKYSNSDKDVLLKNAKIYPYISIYEPLQNGQKLLSFEIGIDTKEQDIKSFAEQANEFLENADFEYLFFSFKSNPKTKDSDAKWLCVQTKNATETSGDNVEIPFMQNYAVAKQSNSQANEVFELYKQNTIAVQNSMNELFKKIENLEAEKEQKVSEAVEVKKLELEIAKTNLQIKELENQRNEFDKRFELQKFQIEMNYRLQQEEVKNELGALRQEAEESEKKMERNFKYAKETINLFGGLFGSFLGLNNGLGQIQNENEESKEEPKHKPKRKAFEFKTNENQSENE